MSAANETTRQAALSELLSAQGFAAMSRDALDEHDPATLRKYARIVLKNTRDLKMQMALRSRFVRLGLA